MTGCLSLLSIGPGALEQLTQQALTTLQTAEVVVGYKSYLQLIAPLLVGKEVVGSGMRQEVQRCTEACRLALSGRRTVLISSGDVGIYGMAGLAFEVLLQSGWSPESGMSVQVIPGISAVNACAALVGAPLTHDFCTISLSDLLTPWPVIEKRLLAAAQADFVTALYNPKSSKRTRQIETAQRIFLSYRLPTTPVAVVTAAFRDDARITLTDLARMTAQEITMETTVLIGNSSSFIHAGVMVTPRGYGTKYEIAAATGERK
ncbi:MAG: precorrin-3B C(17)-methyltransferase [Magnetococcales bacterium]|nr:precorrin-3B C(17)-methyltransferase [Magnetococcales bacterium]